MADATKDSTKVEEKQTSAKVAANPSVEPSAEELSQLEDIDKFLQKEDPKFVASISAIGPDSEMQVGGESLEYTLQNEISVWKYSTGVQKIIYKLFPFMPRLFFGWRNVKIKIRELIIKLKIILKGAGPILLKASLSSVKKAAHFFSEKLRSFGFLSLKKKLSYVGFVLLIGLTVFIGYRTATKGLLPESENLFINSMQDFAQESWIYDTAKDVDSFYESTHTTQNMILMTKMVVNLKRSANSSENPMGAFEFYVEGAASEATVEIKDREAEMRDLFQRSIEETSYDQIASGEGKQHLSEKLRKEINKVLTKGKVRRVYIKTALLKP